MVILGNVDSSDSMGWFAAALLGIPFVIGPQVAMIQYVCRVSIMGFPQSHRRALVGTVFGGLILLVCALREFGAEPV